MNKICSVVALGGVLSLVATSFAITATDPSPRYNFKHVEWWFGRFDRLRELAAKEGPSYKIAFIGDSITENWEASGTNVWNRTFVDPKYKAICLGFGGDRTENLLWRVKNGQLDGLDPKAVVLLIGANNIFFRTEREEPPADTVRAVSEIVKCVQEKCPNAKILLNAVIPADEQPDSERRLRGGRINEQLRRLADGERVLWVNFGRELLEPDGTLTKETSPDFVHPGEKGYVIWTETLMPYLDWCLGYSDERPQDAAGEKDVRSSFWSSRIFAEKRDEIAANHEHYYDVASIGDFVSGRDEADLRRRNVARISRTFGYRILDVPVDFKTTVADFTWAVENAGLCDGYSARFVALAGEIWKSEASGRDAEAILEEVRKLIAAVRIRQPQAKIILESLPDLPEELSAGLRRLADDERIFSVSDAELKTFLKKMIK